MANTKKITVDQLNEVVQDFAGKNDERFVQKETGKGLSHNDYDDAAKTKLEGITSASTSAEGLAQLSSAVDSESETLAATPKAVKAAYDLAGTKANASDVYAKSETYTKEEVNAKVASAFKPAGSKAAADLTSDLLVEANMGNVYNLTTELEITAENKSLFTENNEGSYPVGTNVGIVKDGEAYKFDVLAGFVDTSDFAHNADVEAATAEDIKAIKDGIYATSGT